jgi:hypothetical protein
LALAGTVATGTIRRYSASLSATPMPIVLWFQL